MAEPDDTDAVRVEPSPKRLRALLGGQLVFDTLQARLVWEVPYYPHYYVPRGDVRAKLVPTGHHRPSRQRGKGVLWTVEVDGHRAAHAAATFDDSPVTDLHGLVRFKWDALDAWFEEDEEVFTHARNPYTRIDILPSSRHIAIESRGVTVGSRRVGLPGGGIRQECPGGRHKHPPRGPCPAARPPSRCPWRRGCHRV